MRAATRRGGSVATVLAGAVMIPDTALLVPGAAGRATVLTAVRAAADEAVRGLVTGTSAGGPDGIVVVVPGGRGAPASPALAPPGRPGLGGTGVPDDALGDLALRVRRPSQTHGPTPTEGAAASVGLLALAAAGWSGGTRVLVAAGDDPAVLAEHGATLAAAPGRLGLLLVGSLSARRGPDGPLATDERAPAVEDAVVADLVDLGPHARRRLAAVPATLAAELAVSAWGPWQVLVGAGAGTVLGGAVLHRSAPFGATYVVAAWRPAPAPEGPGREGTA